MTGNAARPPNALITPCSSPKEWDQIVLPVSPLMHWNRPQTPMAKTLPVVGSPTTLDQPTRGAGTSERKTLNTFSQSVLPLAASRQTTFSPSISVSGLSRTMVYSLPLMQIGVERPPRSSRFQSRFSPLGPRVGDQRSTSPFSRETPLSSGPRQLGQSIGSALNASPGRKVPPL